MIIIIEYKLISFLFDGQGRVVKACGVPRDTVLSVIGECPAAASCRSLPAIASDGRAAVAGKITMRLLVSRSRFFDTSFPDDGCAIPSERG